MSTSVKVLEFLRAKPEGFEFSRVGLQRALPSESPGGISGFVARLLKEGAISVASQKRGLNGRINYTYRVEDLGSTNAKETRSLGGKEGRQSRGHTSTERIAELLLQIASQVAELRTPLSKYETRELLRELQRRTEQADERKTPGTSREPA